MTDQETIAEFTDLYWNRKAPWMTTRWLGQGVAKCPLDLFVYQEIIFETKPTLIIETGSCVGGSALFFASLFDMMGAGRVVTVDNHPYVQAAHPRITYVLGDSLDVATWAGIRNSSVGERVMVSLDSLHTHEHVSAELLAYAPLVSPDCYLVVEDTGVDQSWGKPAASAALTEFLAGHPDFVVDRSRESHLLTLNPGGWVKRTDI